MSRSPEKIDESTPLEQIVQFSQSYAQLGRYLSSGRSFSGRERHCAYLNTGDTSRPRFANVSNVSGIDFDDDGRAMATTDWDFDGDLDFWISNRTGPRVRFLQNKLESTCGYLSIRLKGNGTTCNRDGIGTRVEVRIGDQTLLRTLKAGDGFLTQSSKWLHFGLGTAETIDFVRVNWPDGKQQIFSGVERNRHYHVEYGNDEIARWIPPDRRLVLNPSVVKPRESSEKMRLALHTEAPLPHLTFNDLDGKTRDVREFLDEPLVLNIWASWCGPCLAELKQFQEHNINVVALSVDGIDSASPTSRGDARSAFSSNGFRIQGGFADTKLIKLLQAYNNSMLNQFQQLPISTSFLIKTDGTVSVIYKGAVESSQLMGDIVDLNGQPQNPIERTLPFHGRWLSPPRMFDRTDFASHLIKEEMLVEASDYVLRYFANQDHLRNRNAVLTKLTQKLRVHGKHDLVDQLESNPQLRGPAPQF